MNWPRFRGPSGDGIAGAGAVIADNLNAKDHLKWKVPVPAVGHSSPIIWDGRIFVTGEGDHVFAFSADSGNQLWSNILYVSPPSPASAEEQPWEPGEHGTALATPCTDGKNVYAFFGDGVVGCVDLQGRQLWATRVVTRPQSSYGLSSSPVVHKGLVILQVDQKVDETVDPPANRSFLVALHTHDGREAWRKPRPVRDSWSSPIIVSDGGRDILVTTAAPFVMAYDPATGEELWRAGGLAGDVAASPVCANRMIYASSDESGPLLAVRMGGRGDVTASHVAWTHNRNMPAAVSPACDGRLLFQTSAGGTVIALDSQDGSEMWQRPLATCFASPILADGKILFIDEDGVLHILRAADGAVLGQTSLGEKVTASPALVGTRLYVRTAGHLLCLDGAASAAR